MKRHGFVTFWLWLGIIINIISAPFSLITYQNLKNLGEYGMQLIIAGVDIQPSVETIATHALVMQIVAVLSAIILIIGYRKLLNWQKSGFWINACAGVIGCVVNIFMMHSIGQEYLKLGLSIFQTQQLIMTAIGCAVSILILWAILQIRKDGVSCWKQLK